MYTSVQFNQQGVATHKQPHTRPTQQPHEGRAARTPDQRAAARAAGPQARAAASVSRAPAAGTQVMWPLVQVHTTH